VARLKQESPLAYLALGRIAHDSLLVSLGEKRSKFPFGHGAEHALSGGAVLFDSYHCSRYNTNTGVLTTAMFEDVVGRAAAFISRPS
jgi:uracil-DNA glycosylase